MPTHSPVSLDKKRCTLTIGGPMKNHKLVIAHGHDWVLITSWWGFQHCFSAWKSDATSFSLPFSEASASIRTNSTSTIHKVSMILKVSNKTLSRSNVRPFIASSSNVREPGSTFVDRLNLFSLFELIKTTTFPVWSYPGSLTTPSKFFCVNIWQKVLLKSK